MPSGQHNSLDSNYLVPAIRLMERSQAHTVPSVALVFENTALRVFGAAFLNAGYGIGDVEAASPIDEEHQTAPAAVVSPAVSSSPSVSTATSSTIPAHVSAGGSSTPGCNPSPLTVNTPSGTKVGVSVGASPSLSSSNASVGSFAEGAMFMVSQVAGMLQAALVGEDPIATLAAPHWSYIEFRKTQQTVPVDGVSTLVV